MESTTTFEIAARTRKVAAFVDHFDRHVRELGSHPFRDAGTIARVLRDATSGEQWAAHARLAGKRAPSAKTVAEIVAVYERRAAAVEF